MSPFGVFFAFLLLLQHSNAVPLNQQPLLIRPAPDPYADKPRLTFRDDGPFKLTVFSDLHFGENPWEAWGPRQDVNSVALMRKVLHDELPDYVVLNGDLTTGENTFRENSTTLIDQIVAPLVEAGVPFSSTQGNHDNAPNVSHIAEILREQALTPLSYTRAAPPGVGGQGGPGNYWVPIYQNEYSASPSLVLWFFDSRGGHTPGDNSTALPDWVDASVATWLVQESIAMDLMWGKDVKRCALAFVHIPPHSIQAVQGKLDHEKNPGMNADDLGGGSVQDSLGLGVNGDARDEPFWEALTTRVPNLRAVISGHDHGNEWCAREPSKDVIFCFNKHSGYGGYDSAGWGHGVRNLFFSSPNPTDSLETWIRLKDGTIRARVHLDENYGK